MAAPKGNENRAKVKGEKRVMVSIRLSPATIARIKAIAKAKSAADGVDVSQADVIDLAISRLEESW